MPPSDIRVHAVVWAYGRGETDTQTRVTTMHFASSTTHAKCNELTGCVHGLRNHKRGLMKRCEDHKVERGQRMWHELSELIDKDPESSSL